MTTETGYSPKLIEDGPVFRDELRYLPQDRLESGTAESLRFIPTKSAADGVHAIYFTPVHRNWALVRLARRYRWFLEIQLNRGFTGERQLLGQRFEPADVEFFLNIVPQPPTGYNPVVYEILWLVAAFDEYLSLAREMRSQEAFTPREIVAATPEIDADSIGLFGRFLRSHLIRPDVEHSEYSHTRSNPETGDRSVKLDKAYEVTDEGKTALNGIVAEYERIFESAYETPLLINPDADPQEHLRAVNETETEPTHDIKSMNDVPDNGILSDIADVLVVDTDRD